MILEEIKNVLKRFLNLITLRKAPTFKQQNYLKALLKLRTGYDIEFELEQGRGKLFHLM